MVKRTDLILLLNIYCEPPNICTKYINLSKFATSVISGYETTNSGTYMRRISLFVFLVLFGSALFLEFKRLTIKPWPAKHFADDVEHFKYGSIGGEVNGYPYLIWRELPDLFPEKAPDGFKTFGFNYEDNQEIPIGVSVRRYGVNRVGFNCSACHVGSANFNGTDQLILGAPAQTVDLQAYIRFLAEVSTDPRLTADAVFDNAKKSGRPINPLTKMVYKRVVFPRLSEEVANLETSLAWMNNRADHGPGRTDAGNFWRSRWGLEPEKDNDVGVVDFPAVWNQRERLNGSFHWDGNNSSLDERNISAALAGGAADWLLEKHNIGRVSEWLEDLEEPVYPGDIQTALAEAGREVYVRENCQACHEPGYRLGKVTPKAELRTDPERTDLFSDEMVEYFSQVGEKYSWHFKHYEATDGYVNTLLDGIWARGPYLHNGSVPTLSDLLSTPSDRPESFYTGCTEYDEEKLGYKCSSGFNFDTTLKGNSNTGHDYGATLSETDKLALLEYLKTK